jgi:NDP-sugar pyrophosphorylase family protein
MIKPTLVILAAGMASRYGSQKQTEGFGPSGETIMEYSIYDAIRAGFGKVVFIIRQDFAENFKATILPKLENKISVDFVYQERDSFVEPAYLPADRTKPWGTAHAMLCAKNAVKEPFAIINADDFYGQDAFKKAYNFLQTECAQNVNAIIGYTLSKTLSEHGTVSRGVCDVDANNNLTSITERVKIYTENNTIVYEENEQKNVLPEATNVSMNFWCFHPSIFNLTEILFNQFPKDNIDNIKAEFFIPIIADHFINKFEGTIKLVNTSSQWFGVTYKEDAPGVKQSLDTLISEGVYPNNLWF